MKTCVRYYIPYLSVFFTQYKDIFHYIDDIISCKYIYFSRIFASKPATGSKGIGLFRNSDSTDLMNDGAISSLNYKHLKLGHFIYLSYLISSIESDVNIGRGKAWTVIEQLSTTWKSYLFLFDNIKHEFFYVVPGSVSLKSYETLGGKARWEQYNCTCCFEQILWEATYKAAAVRSHTSHLTDNSIKTNKTCWTLLEKKERSHVTFSYELLYMG